jgi:hypothetical protein
MSMATTEICACPGCECEVSNDEAIRADGKAYCCEACATGHPNGEKCQHADCGCGETA